jgi:UDP-N-acetylglucosamine--N-acetylmuramyl-(pentapeptide) pyrophosphoryl-undecaprenol N-acetylglucosamine transferase
MRVLIAGGGTGGHLYPGIAIAEEVTARGGEVLFVGTTRGLEARVVPAAGYALELLEVSGLKRMGALALARGLGRLPGAYLRSLGILRRFRPDVVLGVGGYASGPLVMAAALGGRPSAIQEQNSVPGFTNRVLGRVVKAVFTGFAAAAGSFPAGKVVHTGNPVRRAFVSAAAAAKPGARTGNVLVVGGSQGARAVNDLVLGAVELWARRGQVPALVHQTGAAEAERLAPAYARLGVGDRVTVRAFIDDMVAAYTAADLVIGRAGALTLAELAMTTRPALLVPLPTAADDHQSKNAEAFAADGAAVVLPQATTTAAALAATVEALLADASRRQSMAAAMQRLARPAAARDIVDRLEALARR